jgi:hypothetical protein
MKKVVKINIKKTDELPVIAEQVFSAEADEIILVVPKFSKLAESIDNLKFLKGGFVKNNKTLSFESVDDQLVSLAIKVGFAAENPFFSKAPESLDLDLNDNQQETKSAEESVAPEEVEDNNKELEENVSKSENKAHQIFKEVEQELDRSFDTGPKKIRFPSARKPGLMPILALFLIVIGVWAAIKILPQAEVKIITKKTPWKFQGEVIIDKRAVASDLQDLKIPGQVFTQRKNGELRFTATEKKLVKRKATGRVTIYNNHSTKPQQLVATTRFQTNNGKVFRIDKGVIVPGAKKIDGKLVPSSITTAITADQPGASYNVGPIRKLSIPGFKRSPDKYAGFYGEFKEPLSGGLIGNSYLPNKKDLAAGKEKSIATLKSSLEMTLKSQVPDDFKILEGATQVAIINERLGNEVDENNKFPVFTEIEASVMGFREKDLLAALKYQIAQDVGKEYSVKSYKIAYDLKRADLDSSKLFLDIDFSAILVKPINENKLRQQIVGKSESDLKASIFGLPGLENAQVSLWPFWVSKVPYKQSKIKISID